MYYQMCLFCLWRHAPFHSPAADSLATGTTDDESSGRRAANSHLSWSGGGDASASESSPSSLLAGRWLLIRSDNLPAFNEVVAMTDVDMQVIPPHHLNSVLNHKCCSEPGRKLNCTVDSKRPASGTRNWCQ